MDKNPESLAAVERERATLLKNEKGAITLVVLIGMLVLTTFLMSMYIQLSNKAQTSAETTKQIAEQYNNIGDKDRIYESHFASEDIIPIYTVEQLKKIGTGEQLIIDGKIYTFSSNAYYVIKRDLNLGGVYNSSTDIWSGTQWTPITNDFTGTLDGFGHKITGLYINNSKDNQGLFGTLKGTVKNLEISDGYVKGNNYVAAIAGLNNGTITNCKNKSKIEGNSYVGGIAGNLDDKITECYNTGSIIGESNVTGGYFKSMTTEKIVEKIWSDNALEENIYFVSGQETATVPKGFKVSKNVFEQTIEEGMVIQDKEENEFVWIPASNLKETYIGETNYSEPAILDPDESNISEYYKNQDLFEYSADFDYKTEYEEMAAKVNKYGGFYIGRYETTIDENGNIGSKYNTKVLTAGETFFTKDGTNYPYRWYGLYYVQKKANVTGNNTDVQTAMIYGQLWDKTMEYIRNQKDAGKTNYNVDSSTSDWHKGSEVVNSGQANKTTVGMGRTIGDVALNIWDLESNAWEWTQEAYPSWHRVKRGGNYRYYESALDRGKVIPDYSGLNGSSRLVLYIK